MKKILALLLAAVMCFSLVACGSEQPNTDNNSTQEQQAENSDNEPDITASNVPESVDKEQESTEPESTEPENTEPQYEAVEITLENWQDYFELYAKNNFAKNAFGEFDRWLCDYYFLLKDGIEIATDNNTVAFECKYTVDRVQYTIDLDTQTVTYGEILEPAFWTRQEVFGMGWTSIYDVSTFESVGVFGCDLHQSTTSYDLERDILKVNNFEIISIEGTLYIAK